MQNLKYIDSLRGIAILMVMVVHSQMFMKIYGLNELPLHLENFIKIGHHGVALFFLVSGYTLFRSLHNRHETGYTNYFIRRFFRIAPTYYFILFTIFLIDGHITLQNLLSHYIFINGFFIDYYNSILHVEWTIFVEMLFYLLLPLIYYYKDKIIKISTIFLIISLISLIVGATILKDTPYQSLLSFSPLKWFFVFMIGGIVFQYGDKEAIKKIIVTKRIFLTYTILIIMSIFAYLKLPGDYIIFVPLLTLFFLLNKHNHILLFNNPLYEWIGKISFSVYLIHMPIFSYISKSKMIEWIQFDSIFMNYIAMVLISVSITLIISVISFIFIEKPFINLGKKLISIRISK